MAVFSFLSSERKQRGRIIPKRQTKPKRGRALRTAPRLENLEDRVVPTSTWMPLAHVAPEAIGTMMLLPDGTVMAEGNGTTNHWYKLAPDSSGSYANGTWTARASMRATRLYFASNVLTDGRVFVQGGEYSSDGGFTRTGEVYNPVTNTWTNIANFPLSQFGDDPSELLPDGRVLTGHITTPATYIYNPTTDTWTFAANKLRNDQSDEETWIKLPDNSILSYDVFASIATGVNHAQRYVPATNTWVDAGTLPPPLLTSTGVGYELGPAFLLPDGRVWQIGATNHTAFYQPATNTWTAGPDLPSGMGADDAPGAPLPNGHVIFTADHPLFGTPTRMFDFDPTTNTLTDITTTLPSALQSVLSGNPSYPGRMLVLPSGQILFAPNSFSSTQLYVYTPDGSANPAWKPTISSITDNGDGSFTLTGTQLNGISEGASYGDDAEMSSNYPLVRLVDSTGNVFYARTFNWSSTGVATGNLVETVKFVAPAGVDVKSATIFVVANGIASDPFVLALTVTNVTPTSAALSLGKVRVTFNQPVQTSSFTPDQAVLKDPSGVAIPVTVDVVAGSGNTQFDLSFATQTTRGNYSLTIGPNILDATGKPMDKAYSTTLSIGPMIIADSGITHGATYNPGALDTVLEQVTFNEPMDPTTFTPDQVVIYGASGNSYTAISVTAVDGSSNTKFNISFKADFTDKYTVVIGPSILDTYGNVADSYSAITFNVLGPKITSNTFIPNALPGTPGVEQVTFNEAMDPNRFGTDQVVINGPGDVSYFADSVTVVAGTNNTTFKITYTANATGTYKMFIGPSILDKFGNAMDQNGNFVTGEIPDDQYVFKFNVLGPSINLSTTMGDNTNQVYNDVRVRFNEPMDPTTFTPDQVVFKGPAGNTIPINSITPVAGTNNTQFDVGFDFQGKIGNYTMTIGPNVFDTFGNAMDQDGNFKTGEIPGDQFVFKFTVFGPRINFTTPSSSLEPITSLRLAFNKPIDVTTFTPAKIASFGGPNGPLGISGIFAVPGRNFTQFDVDFLPQSTTGVYTMVIGPVIHDLAGNAMDQNGNLIPGEVPGDQFTATFMVGSLRITTPTNGGNFQPGALDQVRLTFNESVNPTTFTPAQIVSFTGPGGAIPVTSVTAVPLTNNTQFDVAFDPPTTTGAYTLVVGPGMQDLYGNKLDQNGNFIPGEDPGDRYTFTFGVLGPKVTGAAPLRDSSGAIAVVRLTFSEVMDPTTFTTDQAVLKSPTGATTIAITGVSPVDGSGNTQFDVSFAPQSTAGSYTLTVGPNVDDTFGNAMDQDGNLKTGEIPGDQFVTKFDPSKISLLVVGSSSTRWNDGSLVITQDSPSQFATQNLAGFDEIWFDWTTSNRDPNVYGRAADLVAFVSAGGGLITDAYFTDYGFVPTNSPLTAVFSTGNDVKETALGKSHPILAGITDAGLSNWNLSRWDYFSATAGMDVLATSSDPNQAVLLAGTFGSGRVVVMGQIPTYYWQFNVGQSLQLLRQAAQWASAFHPGVEPPGGSGGFPGTPSVAPPAPAEEDASPADRVFASIGKQTVLASTSSLDGVLTVNALSRTSSTSAGMVLKGPGVPAPSSFGASAMDPLVGPGPRAGLPLSPVGVKPETWSAADPFDSLADSGDLWNWEA
jgi:hypothetical protein